MKSLFVMDPLDRINVRGDSTYVTMRECADRGLPTWMCVPGDLFVREGVAYARATPIRTTAAPPHFHPEPAVELALGAFDVVWMRKDPPFDMTYIFTCYLLDMAPASTLVVNRPSGLMRFNEKLWVQRQWPEFQPPTLISRRMDQLEAFARARTEPTVLKPWDGNGGRGVLVTAGDDRNLRSMIELLTREGQDYVIAQGYIAGVVHGDKRIVLFDGDPVGAMLRVPDAREHRANMHVGATVRATELSPRDRAICDAIGPELKKQGMLFVGIDVIDGHLTEVNVTSPTGLQELNRLYGTKLEADLVDRVLGKLAGGAA